MISQGVVFTLIMVAETSAQFGTPTPSTEATGDIPQQPSGSQRTQKLDEFMGRVAVLLDTNSDSYDSNDPALLTEIDGAKKVMEDRHRLVAGSYSLERGVLARIGTLISTRDQVIMWRAMYRFLEDRDLLDRYFGNSEFSPLRRGEHSQHPRAKDVWCVEVDMDRERKIGLYVIYNPGLFNPKLKETEWEQNLIVLNWGNIKKSPYANIPSRQRGRRSSSRA